MTEIADLHLIRRGEALKSAASDYRKKMEMRWPQIDFDAAVWPLNTLYQTRMLDVRFNRLIEDFSSADPDFVLAARCLIAKAVLEGIIKDSRSILEAWRQLSALSVPLATLSRHHLDKLELETIASATRTSAHKDSMRLSKIGHLINALGRLGAIDLLGWSPNTESMAKLKALTARQEKYRRESKSSQILDRQIEGLSDATKAAVVGDKRLTPADRSAVSAINLMMCAPSRINEPLCLRVTDRYAVPDYAKRPDGDDVPQVYQAHQLMLMKGSKGADWNAKPILNFMISLSTICWELILELGKRSRMLVTHYESSPDALYLPTELQYLAGQPITKRALWKISNLTDREPTGSELMSVSGIWKTILQRQAKAGQSPLRVDNPRTHRSNGQRNNFGQLVAAPWKAVEDCLLTKVNDRMMSMRRISEKVFYRGRLSEMLMLVDTNRTPYLPQAWSDSAIRSHLKTTTEGALQGRMSSVFIKLGLKMTVAGKLVDCYIEPHDTRRWLTTKALEARERVSDVLINKWANRLNIDQLAAYDKRDDEVRATQAALPVPSELEAITAGLKQLDGLEREYGLFTQVVAVSGDQQAVTSVEAVQQATADRPVARSGNQIIVLYPTRFGICLHQHHETPCTYYAGCSRGCNESVAVKGHLPTNEEWRKRRDLTSRSIINQLRALISARNRQIADDPENLDAHLLSLVTGLDAEAMTEELIERFHEIKGEIRDVHFRHDLEAAFVAHGVVRQLDDDSVASGALIKYHDPSRHASPGHERAVEARLGSRDLREEQERLFYESQPDLAPEALRLSDQRRQLEEDPWQGGEYEHAA